MVKWEFVSSKVSGGNQAPIGVMASYVQGFDRVAARPLLLLPPLLLDLFLWLGPKVTISPLMERVTSQMGAPIAGDEALQEQVRLIRDALATIGEQFNLLTSLSSIPTGVPSLMAAIMPESAPVELFSKMQIGEPGLVLMAWLALTVVGLGLGSVYHRWIARAAAPEANLPSGLWAWGRLLLLALMAYGGLLVGGSVALVLAATAAVILPLLGIGVSFVAFSLLFWLVVYLIFTPHGIIRYRFGVLRAMIESALIVRWNFLPTVGFLASALFISWVTNMVWALPESSSWYSMLAIVGHAFISGMIITSSYTFYQSRREWLVRARAEVESRLHAMEGSTGTEEGNSDGGVS